MKKLLTMAWILLTISTVFAQQNKPQNKNSEKKLSKTNRSVRIASPLLNNYDVKFYFLDIELERTSTNIKGKVQIDAKIQSAQLDTFAFELINNLTIDSVILNSEKLNVSRIADMAYAKLNSPLLQNQTFSAVVYYGGSPSSGGFFSGISNASSQSWGNQVTWTLSEPFNAYQWWPCKQELTDKADSSWVYITTDVTNKAGSNGLLTATTPLPNNKHRFEWKSKYAIDYYLISASVAKYVDYSYKVLLPGAGDSTLVQNFVYDNPNTLPYFKTEIDRTADFLKLYSELYGVYPFWEEKYGHCMAPIGGGMEHQTMTTLGFFNFYLTCHELAHQWFGDHVTCATWQDIWINEGWASYSEYFAAQYLDSYQEAQNHMQEVHTNVMSETGGHIYIPITETIDENRIFDSRLSYDKGSAAIHMMRFEIGDDTLFFDFIKTFQSQYGSNVANTEEFINLLETKTARQWDDFFDEWIYGEGFPTYNVSYNKISDTLHLNINQTVSATTPLFTNLMEYQIKSPQGDTSIFVHQTANNQNFKIYMPRTVTNIVVDPNNWVVNKVGTITSVTDEEINVNLQVNPNPFNDQISITGNFEKGTEITISDITGKTIQKMIMENNKIQINTQDFNAGIYFVNIKNNSINLVRKIVKN